ncbi:hypothetical protein KR059_010599 [Drosophila kikkawai]|nr:hypothetical protein KR059_010599 [Drosophila kikkawai]
MLRVDAAAAPPDGHCDSCAPFILFAGDCGCTYTPLNPLKPQPPPTPPQPRLFASAAEAEAATTPYTSSLSPPAPLPTNSPCFCRIIETTTTATPKKKGQ